MNTPFTAEQFFDVFAQYNTAVWPLQFVFYLLALGVIFLTFRKGALADRAIAAILGFFWLWIGVVYHITFFSTINPLAYLFGGLFVLQGLLFLFSGALREQLPFGPRPDVYGVTGAFFILYALLIYPLLGHFLGHVYPESPTFGLPCPTTIFTFGLLLWTARRVPRYLLIIPVIWAFIGFLAAVQWGVLEDVMLLVSGLVTTALLLFRDKSGNILPALYRQF